jgi:hypothetical protein
VRWFDRLRLIARLALDGHDTSHANRLLDLMMEVQALFESYRQKITDGLNKRIL